MANIGIFFKRRPSGGGNYQFFSMLLSSLAKRPPTDRIYVFHLYDLEAVDRFEPGRMTNIKLTPNVDAYVRAECSFALDYRYEALFRGKKVVFKTPSLSRELAKAASDCSIDLMIYPNPEREAFEIGGPFAAMIPDIAHKIFPEFPEFSQGGIYEQREFICSNILKTAKLVFADSETGRAQIAEHYSIPRNSILPLPFVPSPLIAETGSAKDSSLLRRKYSLPQHFVFYPAQFWPHKNHILIVRALSLLKVEHSLDLSAVFVGSKQEAWGEFDRVMKEAEALGVRDRVLHLGYVSDRELAELYELALALVMPTFLGPTNIPIVEAFSLGCPVITTDMPGAREQAGDAALFIDPMDPRSLSEAIAKLCADASLRKSLREKAFRRTITWNEDAFHEAFNSAVDNLLSM